MVTHMVESLRRFRQSSTGRNGAVASVCVGAFADG